MTDTEINIAIAKACGNPFCVSHIHLDRVARNYLDYCHDLNAMNEAEKTLDERSVDERSMYWDYLLLCVASFKVAAFKSNFERDWMMLRAKANERAEAFLRTLGKWKE